MVSSEEAKKLDEYRAMPNNELLKQINQKLDKLVELLRDDISEGVRELCEDEELTEPKRQNFYSKDWIGCLCRFWDDSKYKNCAKYDILIGIDEDDEYPFVVYSGGVDINYRYCEPVTVEDTNEEGRNLIYSGSSYVTGWENGVPTKPQEK